MPKEEELREEEVIPGHLERIRDQFLMGNTSLMEYLDAFCFAMHICEARVLAGMSRLWGYFMAWEDECETEMIYYPNKYSWGTMNE